LREPREFDRSPIPERYGTGGKPKAPFAAVECNEAKLASCWLPQKQGLCQVVCWACFWNIIRLLTGISLAIEWKVQNNEDYEIGKQMQHYAELWSQISYNAGNASL